MRPSYDLVSAPWVPCLLPDGTRRLCSLVETLTEAPRLAAVADPSPLVTAALHRFLLAVLHRVFGPVDAAAWHALWQRGEWPRRELTAYLERWRDRFDLFNAAQPFGQAVGLPEKLRVPASRLVLDHASGTRATLFDHSRDQTRRALTPAAAARHLLAYQQYCLSGRCGGERGLVTVRSGPLAHAALFRAEGRNLFETLLLNLVPYSPEREVPWPCRAQDRPAWEQPSAASGAGRPAGYLDYLTWHSRRILLLPSREPTGEVVVREVIVTAGRDLDPEEALPDPALAWRQAAVAGRRGVRWRPLALVARDSWWRLGAQLVSGADALLVRPPLLSWWQHLGDRGYLAADYPGRLEAIGLNADRARVLAWAHLHQPLPLAYLRDADLAADLEHALRVADQAAAALAGALRSADVPGGPAGEGYWRSLEGGLEALLARLPGDLTHRDAVLAEWASACGRAAHRAYREGTRHQRGVCRRLRSVVEAEGGLLSRLHRQVLRPYYEELADVAD